MKASREHWLHRYQQTRRATEQLAAPLSPEDQMLQAMPDASPTKWHRAHTTWFFETFLLQPRGVPLVSSSYQYLFNSYYEAVGPRHARPKRGLLSRPSAEQITAYRRAVDEEVVSLLERISEEELSTIAPLLALGVAHEEQHQELILTDILAAFAENPIHPVYLPAPSFTAIEESTPHFLTFEGGLSEIGTSDEARFFFDNEGPRHQVFVRPFSISTHLIRVRDVLAFIEAKGYQTPSLWLSDGWDWVQKNKICAPGYSFVEGDSLWLFTLHGLQKALPESPASHLSFYEADALARFLGGRLPTEAEWELCAKGASVEGQFREQGALTPRPHPDKNVLSGLFGGVWEWTSSSYGPYPGYAPGPGALGEYNGKFMINQVVLRGGSCLSNQEHLRPTYRNFWHPWTRFQMTGARVARDVT